MMNPVQGTATLPAALNYLASVDQLIVKQKKELLESKSFLQKSFFFTLAISLFLS